jgi:hypothetical protein
MLHIRPNRLTHTQFNIGDIIERDGSQYEIADYEGPYLVLRLLPADERVELELISNRFQ